MQAPLHMAVSGGRRSNDLIGFVSYAKECYCKHSPEIYIIIIASYVLYVRAQQ
jgi:hypothetical protein